MSSSPLLLLRRNWRTWCILFPRPTPEFKKVCCLACEFVSRKTQIAHDTFSFENAWLLHLLLKILFCWCNTSPTRIIPVLAPELSLTSYFFRQVISRIKSALGTRKWGDTEGTYLNHSVTHRFPFHLPVAMMFPTYIFQFYIVFWPFWRNNLLAEHSNPHDSWLFLVSFFTLHCFILRFTYGATMFKIQVDVNRTQVAALLPSPRFPYQSQTEWSIIIPNVLCPSGSFWALRDLHDDIYTCHSYSDRSCAFVAVHLLPEILVEPVLDSDSSSGILQWNFWLSGRLFGSSQTFLKS